MPYHPRLTCLVGGRESNSKKSVRIIITICQENTPTISRDLFGWNHSTMARQLRKQKRGFTGNEWGACRASNHRPVSPPPVVQTDINDSVNRGGNTIVLNPEALTRTPNLIFQSMAMRRGGRICCGQSSTILRGLSIKAQTFRFFINPDMHQ